jgi:hypothetical protein
MSGWNGVEEGRKTGDSMCMRAGGCHHIVQRYEGRRGTRSGMGALQCRKRRGQMAEDRCISKRKHAGRQNERTRRGRPVGQKRTVARRRTWVTGSNVFLRRSKQSSSNLR